MSVINAVLEPIIRTILGILQIYQYIVIISILLSWVRPDPYNPIVRFIYSITHPLFHKIRQLLPFLRMGMFDLSPIAIFVLIQIIQKLLVLLLNSLR